MDRGHVTDWLETLGKEIGSAIMIVDETIQKSMKALSSNVKELWSNLIKEIDSAINSEIADIIRPEEECSPENDRFVTEIKETYGTWSSEVQVEKGNQSCEETESSDEEDKSEPSDEDNWYSFGEASSDSEWELV
ncbi:PREDICTED: uncharacterized protein LOC104812636 [Tarenaya hassleriana]|uniref:uncharacterized protein LOC104812636 n=1 Tax=Tarenaya hassleriana TaxID=28532 RepID=UPI00053C1307|nr:PREDICTED: uncharacterized protein LOC104812636 [Tarenaya hassleriana]